jgi:hypothetical protein
MEKVMKKFIVQIQFDVREGNYYIPLPDDMLSDIAELGWTTNDDLEWIDNKDGSFSIEKKEKKEKKEEV